MILVTGGTGMVGAHLLFELIQTGAAVRAIYRSEKSLEKIKKVFGYFTNEPENFVDKIDWVFADVTDVPALEIAFVGIEKVYHVAALVSFDERDAKKMRKVNIHGTANIVNLCIANDVEKLCYVSSIATISKSVQKDTIDEEDEFNLELSNYSYAITKYGAEMEVWRGAQEGLDVFIVNPGVILGAGYWKENSGKLFSMVYKESPFYTEGVTGFVGVEDVVSVLRKGMDSEIKNERFILVAENRSFKEILYRIAAVLNKKKPSIRISPFLSEVGWRLSWFVSVLTGKKNSFSKQSAKSSNNKSYYNIAKVEQVLDFRYQEVNSVIKNIGTLFLKDHSK
ncbi:NAD-dependent epimerase/dehydratase family protein [Flavicella marina]|uniref:NAD-dependent epimerase/dehydratase family protein n=1 Tax=Flavicella marina TaxID=1475951 RepID=UPI001264C3E8|nr:NAD-dependent epimerase/dehydratase family protein [Flavicella marina]